MGGAGRTLTRRCWRGMGRITGILPRKRRLRPKWGRSLLRRAGRWPLELRPHKFESPTFGVQFNGPGPSAFS
jgi:hypothetical protein